MNSSYTASPEVQVKLMPIGQTAQPILVWMSAYEFGAAAKPDRYIVLRRGKLDDGAYIRVESACIGHMFRLARCDCYDQLVMGLERLADLDNYALIYAYDQDGRANGPLEHIAAIQRMDEQGIPVSQVYPERDKRDYHRMALLIKEVLGLSAIRLMTNNPDRVGAFSNWGLSVERVAFEAPARTESSTVMRWKKEEGHLLDLL